MKTNPPDIDAVAGAEAKTLSAQRGSIVNDSLSRVLENAPRLDREALLVEIESFHAERMGRVPSEAVFPESRPWVDFVLGVDRRVKELAGLSDREMAVRRSLSHYMSFRGIRRFAGQLAPFSPQADPERCRVAFVPDTDRGAVHIKNVDDPASNWPKKRDPFTEYPHRGIVWDGTGSGLHIDDQPVEIFPLPIPMMFAAICPDDVPATVQFLTRYSSFWGRCNVVLYDSKRRSVAIEKCSYNHIQVHAADAHGRSHVSGMVCRDASSPIAKHQKARRDEYRRIMNISEDSPDFAFWAASDRAEAKLAGFLASDSIKADDLIRLFITPRPVGLNKNGDRVHPREERFAYTLLTHAFFLDERKILRWQRDPKDLTWPQDPERYDFSAK